MRRIRPALTLLTFLLSWLGSATSARPQSLPETTSAAGEAPNPVPTEIQFPEIIDKALKVRTYTELGLTSEFVVKGDILFNGPILAAKVLRFEPGSHLRFSREARKAGDLYIVADRIEVPTGVAWIGWLPLDLSAEAPPSRGKAIPGAPGNSHGASGAPGTAGAVGNPGFGGESAPTLYLIVGEIRGAGTVIDVSGQEGATGGQGEAGGDGGAGAPGAPAESARFEILGSNVAALCKRLGGRGGDGGAGGRGGIGGVGGRGGSGGALVLLTPKDSTASVRGKLKVALLGGSGGYGGLAGVGGNGGPPGAGGKEDSGCPGGEAGNPGPVGPQGIRGERGSSGNTGDYIVSVLTKEQYKRLLGKSSDGD